jgi:hypothetical protein
MVPESCMTLVGEPRLNFCERKKNAGVDQSPIVLQCSHSYGTFVMELSVCATVPVQWRKNCMPWKVPAGGGISELGENIDEALIREVMGEASEAGVACRFLSVICF